MAKPGKLVIALNMNKLNKNSFIAIICALEKEKETEDIPLYFLDSDQVECNSELSKLAEKYEKVIFMWSFASFSSDKILESVKSMKKEVPENIILVAGGPHPSGDPVATLRAGFDHVIIGEGEKTVCDLVKCIMDDGDVSKVKGIGFLKERKFIYTGKQVPVDLSDYSSFSKKHRMIGPLEITRGCPWGCRYCQTSYLFGKVPRHRNIAEVKKYAEKIKSNGMKDIRFVTPNAFSYGSPDGKAVNLKAIEGLLKTVKNVLGEDSRIFFGSFPSEVRPEQVTKEALVLLRKYCNNSNLIIGAQSGSQKILDHIRRGHTVEDIRNAAKLAIENGFNVNVDLIFGLPGENGKDTDKTFRLMDGLIAMGATIHGHAFMPLSGTPFSKEKPAELASRDRKKLKEFEAGKKLYGSWESQHPKA
ncbi:MAG: TIGR04013 family B12-binding domain/radical SAM domain-containing protein [Candidatus Paceibacterota bacterium]|jgi:B12-binding domain/radical SAM domain protein